MTKLAILIAVAGATLCAQQSAAIADDVPTFDVRKNCKADVQAYPTAGNVEGCLRDEQNARTKMAKDVKALPKN